MLVILISLLLYPSGNQLMGELCDLIRLRMFEITQPYPQDSRPYHIQIKAKAII